MGKLDVWWWDPILKRDTNLSEYAHLLAQAIIDSYKYYPRRYWTFKVLGKELTMCIDEGYSLQGVYLFDAPKQALWNCCCNCCDKDFTSLMQAQFLNTKFEYEYPYRKPNDYRRIFRVDLFDGNTVIEIKASKGDMQTGYGQNFFGKYNYMLTRPNLVEFAERVLDKEGFDYVGVASVANLNEHGSWHIHRKAKMQREHYL